MVTTAVHYALMTTPIEPPRIASTQLRPGLRVRVTQQVPRLSGPLMTAVEGTVVRAGQQKTGSWFAHGKDDKLWIDRLELRKEDGEEVVLNLDPNSSVEVIGGTPPS